MAAVALLTGTWAAIFLQGHRSQSEPETGLWTCNFLTARVPRCLSQFTGHLRDFQEKCWPHVLASEPNAWVRLRLLGAVSATAHTYRQLASTSEDTSQAKENVDCKWRPHISATWSRKRPLHTLTENPNIKLGVHTHLRNPPLRDCAWARVLILGSVFPEACERWSVYGISLLPRAHNSLSHTACFLSLKKKALQFEILDTHEGSTGVAVTPHRPLSQQIQSAAHYFLAENNLAHHINKYATSSYQDPPALSLVRK